MLADIERMPPQDVATEQAVLGAMMTDERAVEMAREGLTAASFYHPSHGTLYQAILALYDRGQPADLQCLADELRGRGQLDEVGGVVYLATLASQVATWANVRYHAGIIAEQATRRRIIVLAQEVAQRAYEGTDESQHILRDTEMRLMEIGGASIAGGLRAFEEILSDALSAIEEAARHPGQLQGIPTGLSELDEMTGGWQKGDLVLLAARPKMGKSALALGFAAAAAERGHKVAFFSLEMGAEQLAQRHMCMATSIDLHRLRSGRLLDAEWIALTHGAGKAAQLPIYVHDRPGIGVPDVRAAARRMQRERGLGLIVVDYLQIMACHVRVQSREQEVSKISMGMKNLARELEVPIIALSQLSRKLEERSEKRPMLSDLRDSGSLEQDADLVLFVHRPEVYGQRKMKVHDGHTQREIDSTNMGELIVAAQRNGPTGLCWLRWCPAFTRFEECPIDLRHDADYDHPNN